MVICYAAMKMNIVLFGKVSEAKNYHQGVDELLVFENVIVIVMFPMFFSLFCFGNKQTNKNNQIEHTNNNKKSHPNWLTDKNRIN